MKIKEYTKSTFFPVKEMPYEKTTYIIYDSIDDVNLIDGAEWIRCSALGGYCEKENDCRKCPYGIDCNYE